MSANDSEPEKLLARGELVNSRQFSVPPASVFAAFADPAVLAAWWGPTGFTNTFHRFEFRPGGAWRFTMRAPDGAAYEMDHEFLDIVPALRIGLRHHQPGHDFTLSVTFESHGAGTRLTWRMRFDDPGEGERLRAFLVPANEQNLDRLAACLGEPPSSS